MDLYTNGSYLEQNATWHIEDSPWKAKQVIRLLEQNAITPKTVCEIGCGAGEILVQLSHALPETQFLGVDISPQLEPMWKTRRSDRVSFAQQNILENEKFFDVLLYLDVVEHIEDYFGFLRKTRSMGKYKIFNFPLEIYALRALSRKKLSDARHLYGHIHHFNREKCLDLLGGLGFDILDSFYAPCTHGLGGHNVPPPLGVRLLNIPRKVLSCISVDFTTRLLGGYSLFVLAE